MHIFKQLIVGAICTLCATPLHAQNNNNINDASSLALGGASAALESTLHPVGSIWSKRKEVSGSLSKWSNVTPINHLLLEVTHPIDKVQIQSLINILTTDTYAENSLYIGAAIHVHPKLALGVSLNYFALNAKTDDDTFDQDVLQTISAHISLQYRPIKTLTIGCFANNLIQAPFGDDTEEGYKAPRYLAIGAQYEITPQLIAIAEISQYQSEKLHYRLGLEYTLLDHIPLRVGFHTPNNSPTAGIGYYFNRFRLDASFEFGGRIGSRALIGFAYRW